MSFLAASPFLKALGWALVNSLWQFAVCWLIYRALTASLQKLTAAARHTIALCLLFTGTVSFVASLCWKYSNNETAHGESYSILFSASSPYYSLWQTTNNTIDVLMPYWSLLYIISVIFLFIKFCSFVQHAGNLQKNGTSKMNAVWRTYVKTIAAQLGIQREVKALLSVHIDTPQVIGFLKPVILLPAACLINLSAGQLEAVLLHELVHIKRNDYFINLFVTTVEILFFFNPFVKQMTAGIRKEREYSCDDMVIQFRYHPHNYASALLTLEKSRVMPITYGIAAGGKNQQQLLTRIERIMGIKNKQTSRYRFAASLLALLLLAFIAGITPAKLAVDKFEGGGLTLADNNITALQYNDEDKTGIINPGKPAALPGEDKKIKIGIITPGSSPAGNDDTVTQPVIFALADGTEDESATDNIQTAARQETIDFSLQQKDATPIPAEIPEAVAEPYIPANSFSFQLIQDTARPKIKGETYSERTAKEGLIKAQKALEQINWQKIEKQLKYSRQEMAKLKKEITLQLQNMNWQKISNEVRGQLSQEQLDKLQQTLNQGQSIQLYRQSEAYNEAIQRQMAEQDQLMKEAEQRMQDSKKAADLQQKKLEQEMKKRRIIYI
ncbi:MAG: M56 family metallopeptidase [Chitinophagaceae bacterium]